MCYSCDGFTSLCRILSVDDAINHAPKLLIKLTYGGILYTSLEFLQHVEDHDVASVPSTLSQYRKHLDLISVDDNLSFLANPRSLSPLEQEWLLWHNKLNHLSRQGMIQLVYAGLLPKTFLQFRNSAPFCAYCAFGKTHRHQWRHKGSSSHPIRSSSDVSLGTQVSVDQMISGQPGLLAQMSDHLTRRRISCATLFKDHFSGFTYCHLQVSSGHEETLAAKWTFEKFARSCGVQVRAYRADNGRFGEQAFRDECALQEQSITCGVGAHHQNGIAEACVKVSTLGARTLLLHAQRLWPEAITTMLWPFALLEHVRTINHFNLDNAGKSPYMKFASVDSPPQLSDQHPWGCPLYVLEHILQNDSKSLPKWDPRSRLGIYLGHSPAHAGSVALVLNPSTGHVSSQYQLVFDNNFSTVSNMREGTIPPNWRDLVYNFSFSSTDEQLSLADIWLQEHSLDPHDPNSAPALPSTVSKLSEGALRTTPSVSKGASLPPSFPTVSEGDPAAKNISTSCLRYCP